MAEISYRYEPALRMWWFHCSVGDEVVMDMVLERNGLLDLRALLDDALTRGAELDEEHLRLLERQQREKVEPMSVEPMEPGEEPT